MCVRELFASSQVFVLLLRIGGMFQREVSAVAVGTMLCIATFGVFVAALILANRDRLGERVIVTRRKDTDKKAEFVLHQGNGQRSKMNVQEFVAQYEPSPQSVTDPALAREGFQLFLPKAQTWARCLSEEDVRKHFPAGRFVSSSGSPTEVHPGDFVAMPHPSKDKLMVVQERDFDKEYTAVHDKDGDAASSHIPSQEDVLDRWETVLRREGLVYCKIVRVHAKLMREAGSISTIVDDAIENTSTYNKGDYIVSGSRGGQYAMKPSMFESRYDSTRPGHANDAKLAKDGFKLYQATGKVWAHELTVDEVEAHFPAGQLIGSWGGAAPVAAGCYLVAPFPTAGEIYTIKKKLFDDTYRKYPHSEYVLTQREALSVWTREAKLIRAGRLYRSCKSIMAIPPADFDSRDKRSERPRTGEPEEPEAGSSRGGPSPQESKTQAEEDTSQPASPAVRWSMLFFNETALCGAEAAEDDAPPPPGDEAR